MTEINPRLTDTPIEPDPTSTIAKPTVTLIPEPEPVLQLTYFASQPDSNILRFYAITIGCLDRNPLCLSDPELLFELEAAWEGTQLLSHSWSSDGDSLVFAANLDGMRMDLYVTDPHGESITLITGDLDGSSVFPNWSPIGDEIAFDFCSFEECGTRSILSSGIIRAPLFIPGGSPAWSPDGKHIAYSDSRYLQGPIQIYLANLETLSITQLTDSKSDNFTPEFSTDGNKIVFTRYLREDQWGMGIDPNLVIYNLQSRRDAQLTSELESQYYFPAWSPTGDLIAITKTILDREPDIYIILPDGLDEINLTNSSGVWESEPSWRLSIQ